MKAKAIVLLTCFSMFSVVSVSYAQWRSLTSKEETFVQGVEAKMNKILLAAAKGLGSNWDMKIDTDQYMRHEIDEGQHKGRPHEVRFRVSMEYQPSDAEREEMDLKVSEHAKRTENLDPIPDEIIRETPDYIWHMYVSVVVNHYGFMPCSKKACESLGYLTNVPGTFFSYVRWRKLGFEAPKYILYLGDLKRRTEKGDEIIGEGFSTTSDCRNVRTIICEVQSNEAVAKRFVDLLNTRAMNDLILSH